MRIASSMSGASIRLKPARNSLVSANGPSTMRLRPSRTRKVRAVVAADGSIRCGTHQGSIHRVGAAVQNAPSCNGWLFWHFERDGAWLPIDTLRTEIGG